MLEDEKQNSSADDFDFEKINLVDFLNSESDDSTTGIDEETVSKASIVTEKLCEVNQLQIKNRCSYRCAADVINLINNTPGAKIKIPKYKAALQNAAADMCQEKPMFFVFCKACDELVEENEKCACGVFTQKKSKKNNFLVYFRLVPQIRRILKIHFGAIIEYLQRERTANCMSDIDDGQLFLKSRVPTEKDELLTLTMNFDGATIFNSTQGSLWPVQFYLNFLPPAIRFMPENIVVTTVYYGAKKPDISKLIFIIIKELEANDHKISVHTSDDEIVSFGLSVHLISCDLPARAAAQNFVGHNGKYGCPYCLHEGIPIVNLSGKSKTIRYIQQSEMKLRSHEVTVNTSIKCSTKPIYGIKGPSAMLMFPNIDIIHSFSIDFMHGVTLGVMKDMMEIWLGKKKIPTPPCSHFKLKPSCRELLESRILNLKPPSSLRRKPRSIMQISNFKASECMLLMWFYLRYTLPGLLSTKIIKHFEMLSVATYILNKETVTFSEAESACNLLTSFADQFESIYGKGAVTMNLHMLRHYYYMFINCGPLWAHSLFSFENNIGILKTLVCGNVDVLQQISRKYPLSKMRKSDTNEIEPAKLKDPVEMDVGEELTEILLKAGVSMTSPFKVHRRYVRNDEIFTSLASQQEKSCDYFVKLKNNQIGIVQFYFKLKNQDAFLLKVYNPSCINYHWTEVLSADKNEVYLCSDIIEKFMYFEAFAAKFITRMPNRFSRAFC